MSVEVDLDIIEGIDGMLSAVSRDKDRMFSVFQRLTSKLRH